MNNIRLMQPHDVDSVIKVHMDAFQGFFLTFLGSAFLKEFYTGVCEEPSGIAVVCEDDLISGFVVGTVQPSRFYRRLIQKRWWRFALASRKSVLHSPSIVPRLLRALTLPTKTSSAQMNSGTLMSLAVMRKYQGQGVGKQLVSAFLELCKDKQVEIVNLTTDAFENDDVNQFYQSLGFKCEKTFTTPEGRSMNEYVIQL